MSPSLAIPPSTSVSASAIEIPNPLKHCGGPVTPEQVRDVVTAMFVRKPEWVSVAEIAEAMETTVGRVRRAFENGPPAGLDTDVAARPSFSRSYRGWQSGYHQVRIYAPSREHLAGLISRATNTAPAQESAWETPEPCWW